MHEIEYNPSEIESYLKKELPAERPLNELKKKERAFAVHYDPGEIVMPRGVYSEFASLLLQGSVQVCKAAVEFGPEQVPDQGCWESADWLYRSLTWLTRGKLDLWKGHHARRLDTPHPWRAVGGVAGARLTEITVQDPLPERFMGVTSALWNQPRSVTLVAGPQGCDLLLMKRIVLQEIVANSAKFRQKKTESFLHQELPLILAENRLFAEELDDRDLPDEGWNHLANRLRSPRGAGAKRLVQFLRQGRFRLAGGTLDAASRLTLVSELNRLLRNPQLYDPAVWPRDRLEQGAQRLLDNGLANLGRNEMIALNRELFDTTFPDVFPPRSQRWPRGRDELLAFLPAERPDEMNPDPRELLSLTVKSRGRAAVSASADAAAAREGQRPASGDEVFCERMCARPGCYVTFWVSESSACRRFCSPACRLALRRVLDREACYRQRRRRWRRERWRRRGPRPDTS